MRPPFKLLLLFALFSLLPSTSVAQKTAPKERWRSRSTVICKIASVPKGMVVVGYKRHSACSDGSELLVKSPEDGDIICADSPVPPQFSIVTEAQGNLRGTCPTKAFLISGTNSGPATERRVPNDDAIGRAFATHASDVQVEGEGTVIRVLQDDLNGPRHQRFILQLASGQTLLIAHNIDIAPRIDSLQVGDIVRFNGEFVWNEKGGVIHWTHHDPKGRHVGGWLIHNGKTFK